MQGNAIHLALQLTHLGFLGEIGQNPSWALALKSLTSIHEAVLCTLQRRKTFLPVKSTEGVVEIKLAIICIDRSALIVGTDPSPFLRVHAPFDRPSFAGSFVI